jgi:hypothetical protein
MGHPTFFTAKLREKDKPMRRSIVFITAVLVLALPAVAQDSDQKDKSFDVRSSVGDLHVGPDADAKRAGLPLFPGARLVHDENGSPLNFGLLTENFGMKLVVAKYESDDAPEKVISYYRGKLKKYGTVLECHSQKQDDGVQVHSDSAQSGGKNSGDKELTCDQNSGPVTELKVGTDDNQHIVAIEPRDSKGCTFSLVYLHSRKDDEI